MKTTTSHLVWTEGKWVRVQMHWTPEPIKPTLPKRLRRHAKTHRNARKG